MKLRIDNCIINVTEDVMIIRDGEKQVFENLGNEIWNLSLIQAEYEDADPDITMAQNIIKFYLSIENE